MKRSKKLLILLLAVVVLCAGYFGVRYFIPKETVTQESAEQPLLDADASQITKISWEIDDSMFTLIRSDDGWMVDGDSGFPVDQTKAESLVNTVTDLTASRKLTGVTSTSDYGLDSPAFCVTVTTDDGNWYLISQGSTNSLSGGTYMQISGDESVYLVTGTLTESFDLGKEDLLAMESVPSIGDVMTISVTSQERSLELRYVEDGTGEAFVNEEGCRMETASVSDFIAAVKELAWTGCACYNATEEDRAAYGISTPAVTVNIAWADDSEEGDASGVFMLVLGGTTSDGSEYAALSEDSSMIYTVSAETAALFTNALEGSLESTQLFPVDWEKVVSITVTTAEGSRTCAQAAETTETAEAAESTEAAVTTTEGTVVLDSEPWNDLTAAFDALKCEAAENTPTGSVYCSITVHLTEGTEYTVTLLDSSETAYGIKGEAKTCSAADADALLRKVRHTAD